jgi:ubiquinone biosynthesis protein UbiJ
MELMFANSGPFDLEPENCLRKGKLYTAGELYFLSQFVKLFQLLVLPDPVHELRRWFRDCRESEIVRYEFN